MSEDRTTPMRQPQWSREERSRKEDDLDEQETVFADQESVTPPTIPLGDEGDAGWGQPPAGTRGQAPGQGFVRTVPSEGTTPAPFSPPGAPFGAQQPSAEQEQTMIISERPVPVFAWLVQVDGPDRGAIGRVHTLRPDTTTIGRAGSNAIALRDDTVSAQHARVRIEAREDADPAFVLYDMGSRNGTFVGDRQSYKDDENKKYRHELQDGDFLLVGETTLAFKKL
jgi:hypothetical protein